VVFTENEATIYDYNHRRPSYSDGLYILSEAFI
jgi:hypothetical protein